jgi:hypothetical protein
VISRPVAAALTGAALLVVFLVFGHGLVFWVCLIAAVAVGAYRDYTLKSRTRREGTELP